MKRLVLGAVFLIQLLVGCRPQLIGTHVNPGGTTYSYVVTFHGRVYTVTGNYVQKVSKQIGSITRHVQGAGVSTSETSSNEFPVGAKLYEIPGRRPNTAIAVKDSHGYAEAISYPSN